MFNDNYAFLSTPSVRRATREERIISVDQIQFLSTPSVRRATFYTSSLPSPFCNFYPRPPYGGRHSAYVVATIRAEISIHALRTEGDGFFFLFREVLQYFYPRPPYGGRRLASDEPAGPQVFLSTPSVRRATVAQIAKNIVGIFLSTPSVRRATNSFLRAKRKRFKFLSTPSVRRAT